MEVNLTGPKTSTALEIFPEGQTPTENTSPEVCLMPAMVPCVDRATSIAR